MSEDVRAPLTGLIGPNAILQYLPILDRLAGPPGRTRLLSRAGIFELPDGTCMIPEGEAARLHRQVRIDEPEMALGPRRTRGHRDRRLYSGPPHSLRRPDVVARVAARTRRGNPVSRDRQTRLDLCRVGTIPCTDPLELRDRGQSVDPGRNQRDLPVPLACRGLHATLSESCPSRLHLPGDALRRAGRRSVPV